MNKIDDRTSSNCPHELLSLYDQLNGICQNYRASMNKTRNVAHLRLATKTSKGHRYYEAHMWRQNQHRRIHLGTADNPTVLKLQTRRFLQEMIRNIEHDMDLLADTINNYKPTDPDMIMEGLPLAYQTDLEKLLAAAGENGIPFSAAKIELQQDADFEQFAADRLSARGIRLLKRHKELHPEHLTQRTAKGPLVRSKSEVIISNALFAHGVLYLNEPLLSINNTLLAPDFLLLSPRDYDIYMWEHWGLLSKPGYLERNLKKIHDYQTVGFTPGNNLILTADTMDGELDSYQIERILNAWFL